jgi:phosphoglycolate phosphatase
MTRLIVFDCDGTLVDSQHLIVAAAERAFAAEGLAAPAAADVRAVIGLSLEAAMTVLQPAAAPALRLRLVDGYRAAWQALRTDGLREPLYPGALATLHELERRGLLLGVATGKGRAGLDSVLAHHRLSALFVSLQTADRHPGKPHPSMLEAAMRETGSAPEATLMVGDTSYDMTMAHAAGVGAIGVAWGYHPVEVLAKAGAATILERFEDLLELAGAAA